MWADFEQTTSAAPVRAPARLGEAPRYLVVQMAGAFDPTHQFILDNRFYKGNAGYEVLTPFKLVDGRIVLVNRGWLPFGGYRDKLPDIALGSPRSYPEIIAGRLDELPSAGLASGRAPPTTDMQWPKLTAFPTHDELQAALGEKIERRILLLTSATNAYPHEWSPAGLAPDRHFSYAIQWWGFALVLLVLYFGLNFRKVP
jgi:surfeit locus 1 family protein